MNPSAPTSLDDLYAVIRSSTSEPADWAVMAQRVAHNIQYTLPDAELVLAAVPAETRGGSDRSQILQVEPNGTFSVVALITRPGQSTTVHDHTTWCAVAVLAGTEQEERFQLSEAEDHLQLIGTRRDEAGTVSGFAPPGDIHRVSNAGMSVGLSLHIYGTDINRIGSSVRRNYDLPIRTE